MILVLVVVARNIRNVVENINRCKIGSIYKITDSWEMN